MLEVIGKGCIISGKKKVFLSCLSGQARAIKTNGWLSEI